MSHAHLFGHNSEASIASMSSLNQASAAIDEFVGTLSKASRAPTPDSPELLKCCCGREDCDNARAQAAYAAKLQEKLIMCAEVGQALLKQHEAYVRSQEAYYFERSDSRTSVSLRQEPSGEPSVEQTCEQLRSQIASLAQSNVTLEKELHAAMINAQITEADHARALHDLQVANEAITQLTSSQAHSVGWELRLQSAIEEKEDACQERDFERRKVRSLEAQNLALSNRCNKLEAELGELHETNSTLKELKSEASAQILHDAHAQLSMLRMSQPSLSSFSQNSEVLRTLEAVVSDNESLKRDTAELQRLLADSREEVRSLRDEVEETRAFGVPHSAEGHHTAPIPIKASSLLHESPSLHAFSAPQEPSNRRRGYQSRAADKEYEPLTPATDYRVLSPTGSDTLFEPTPLNISAPQPRYASSHRGLGLNEKSWELSESPRSTDLRRPASAFHQDRAVQTDRHGLIAHIPISNSPFTESLFLATDNQSDASSLADIHQSTFGVLIDRTNALYTRILQADALSLTNRLKRQHIVGGDVAHLTRVTVNSVLAEVGALRQQFRNVLEDEKAVAPCSRRHFRALLRLLRDVFAEIGQLRVTLNEVVLDPTCAARISDAAMNPGKAGSPEDRVASPGRGALPAQLTGWMNPLTKLFGSVTEGPDWLSTPTKSPSLPKGLGLNATPRSASRAVPKLAPALAASTTTVNVEFSGAGLGRAVSNTSMVTTHTPPVARATTPQPTTSANAAASIMSIFAGAPARTQEADRWVVVPKDSRPRVSPIEGPSSRSGTLRAKGTYDASSISRRLSRNVDAVIDSESAVQDEEEVYQTTLLERTLRPRGLSDSSIHTTFLNSAPVSPRAQGFSTSTTSKPQHEADPTPSDNPAEGSSSSKPRFIPNVSSWAALTGLRPDPPERVVGSFKEDSPFLRARTRNF